jgi:hypothetical protein
MSQVTQQNGAVDRNKQLQGGGSELLDWVHGLDDLSFIHLIDCVKADSRFMQMDRGEIPY